VRRLCPFYLKKMGELRDKLSKVLPGLPPNGTGAATEEHQKVRDCA
jgi:hypothetical protein